MKAFDTFGLVERIAATSLKNQKVNPGDIYDEDGMLVCGVCQEKRQMAMTIPSPKGEDPGRRTTVKVARSCRCDREREKRKREGEEREKAMERVERLRRASLMDEQFRGATFSTFVSNKYNAENLTLCRLFVNNFEEKVAKNEGMLFWGGVGTGKTYAAACVANELLRRGVSVVMTSFIKILEAIQDGKDRESDIIARLNSAKLVIFDDLGAERSTDYALEKVYNFIDSRYRRRLPMLLTTNLTMDEMKQEIDRRYARIYDRVFEVCVPMQFTGKSWRKKTASRLYREKEKLLECENGEDVEAQE